MFIEILFKMLLFKGGVLIYAEHCMCKISKYSLCIYFWIICIVSCIDYPFMLYTWSCWKGVMTKKKIKELFIFLMQVWNTVVLTQCQIKSNQITFIVTSPHHKCLGEWNSYERAPDSAKKQHKNNNNLHMDSTYLQTVQKTMCKIHIHILSTHSVL